MAGMSEHTTQLVDARPMPSNGAPTPIERACLALDHTIDNLDKVVARLQDRLGFCLSNEDDPVQSMTVLRDDTPHGSSNLAVRLVDFDERVDQLGARLSRLTNRVEL